MTTRPSRITYEPVPPSTRSGRSQAVVADHEIADHEIADHEIADHVVAATGHRTALEPYVGFRIALSGTVWAIDRNARTQSSPPTPGSRAPDTPSDARQPPTPH